MIVVITLLDLVCHRVKHVIVLQLRYKHMGLTFELLVCCDPVDSPKRLVGDGDGDGVLREADMIWAYQSAKEKRQS
jgi:hypothetical protein